VTAKPSKPPTSGPAIEQPPAGDQERPTTTVYKHPRPLLWIFYPARWTLAIVQAKQVYSDGRVVYQVELAMPSKDGNTSRVIRSFRWGPDSIRPA
jgi:hypothetical protein